jgi:hypothetical protein
MPQQSTDGGKRQVEGGTSSSGRPRARAVAGGKAGAMMGCPVTVVSVMPCTGRALSGMGISGLIRILSQMAIYGLIFAARGSKDQ